MQTGCCILRGIIPGLSFLFDAIVILLSDYILFLPRINIFIELNSEKAFFVSIQISLISANRLASSNIGSS